MDVLDSDPVDRLVSGKREFGEFGGVNASVEISTTFTVLEADTLPAIFNGEVGPEKGGCYVYGRAFNPTVRHLGRLLAALEGCEAAYPCSSGMAAISSTLLALCNSGDHIVASNTIYGGSHALLKSFLPVKAGIATTFVDITDLAAVREALSARPTKVIYTEVVSNPTLRVADLRALAQLAHGVGATLVVDNTFTPCVVTPRRFGADVVIHSLTKFASGASDIIAGVVCGSAALIRSLMDFHTGPCMLLGPTMDPKVASELALRLPHLGLRMQEHGRRAAAFAARLEALGAPVTYPGLASHPQHALMAGQANPGYGFGGLLGLDLGSPARANAFMERLQNKHGFGFMAVSLGYFDSLMSLSAASTSSELSASDMAASGIGRGYVRLSVGITGSLEERWRQLEESYRFTAQLGLEGAAPFRAVKLRRSPSGAAAEQVISWPSLGSFGPGVLAEPAPTRAATVVTAVNEAAASGPAAGTDAGGSGGGGGDAGFVGIGKEVEFAAAADMAVSAESGNEEAAETASGPEAAATAVAASKDVSDPAATVVATAVATAATVIKSPFVARRPPRHESSAGVGAANYSAAASSASLPAAPALPADASALRATPPTALPSPTSAGGLGGHNASPSALPAATEPSRTVDAGAPPLTRALAVRAGASPELLRPVKVRRTGSAEILYVAVSRADA